MEVVDKIVKALEQCNVEMAIESFAIEQNDEITNDVRAKLDGLPKEKIEEIKRFLNNLLNLCYNGELLQNSDMELIPLPEILGDKLFLFKETVIYFLGRLSVKPDIDILKKAYFAEDNKYIKLNLAFTSLCTFDETIEMDFVSRCTVGSEYDQMIRSWTMAYFTMANKPYEFVDTKDKDWTEAKLPRIKRLAINDESNAKYQKAMSFRLMDLLVLYLFTKNRGTNGFSNDEVKIVEDADVEYPEYSESKKKLMKEFKRDILK